MTVTTALGGMQMMMMMMRLLGTEHKMGGERGCSCCCLTMMVGESGERGHGMLTAFVGSRWKQQPRPPSSQSLFAWALPGLALGGGGIMPSWGWSCGGAPLLLAQAKAKAGGLSGWWVLGVLRMLP